MSRRTLEAIYRKLFTRFGPQHWWPGDSRFEITVGAILTQNTSWSNAAKAISQLKSHGLLSPVRLDRLPVQKLAELIRSSGYYNQKSVRLKTFVRYLLDRYEGDLKQMSARPLPVLRQELLALPGIGPETADSILLYALGKPIFVVDAYTHRVLARHSLVPRKASYEQIQELFMKYLQPEKKNFNEYHALFVALGKELCKPHPNCSQCPLKEIGHLQLETAPISVRITTSSRIES